MNKNLPSLCLQRKTSLSSRMAIFIRKVAGNFCILNIEMAIIIIIITNGEIPKNPQRLMLTSYQIPLREPM